MYHSPFDVETPVVDSDDPMSFLQNSSERYPAWIVCKTEGSVMMDNTALMDRVVFVYVAVSNDSPGKAPSGTQDKVSTTVLSSPGMYTISISYWDISSCHLSWFRE